MFTTLTFLTGVLEEGMLLPHTAPVAFSSKTATTEQPVHSHPFTPKLERLQPLEPLAM